MEHPSDNDLVLINVRVTRKFRRDLSIASMKLNLAVSKIAIAAFKDAIKKSAKYD